MMNDITIFIFIFEKQQTLKMAVEIVRIQRENNQIPQHQ